MPTFIHLCLFIHIHVYIIYVYVYVYLYIHYMCMYICMCIHIYINTCMHMYTYIHIRMYIYIRMYAYIYAYPCACMHVCMYACMYIGIRDHIPPIMDSIHNQQETMMTMKRQDFIFPHIKRHHSKSHPPLSMHRRNFLPCVARPFRFFYPMLKCFAQRWMTIMSHDFGNVCHMSCVIDPLEQGMTR